MLVLGRKIGQQIIIGEGPDEIVVTIARINGSLVFVGIDAPPNVRIDRKEIRERILRKAATKVSPEEDEFSAGIPK